MNNLEQTRILLVSGFFARYDIRSLSIGKSTTIDQQTLSEVNINFINHTGKSSRDYSVKFKLKDECRDIWQYISELTNAGLVPGEKGNDLSAQEQEALLKRFFQTISPRVEKIRKEEAVQSITYVGNTFTLYKTTTFKVLEDDGEGNLTIEILNKDKDTQTANMTSHSLLDGLYLGSIQPLEN